MFHTVRRNAAARRGVAARGQVRMSTSLKDTGPLRRLRALLDFLRSESAGGAILIVAALLALLWANSGFGGLYSKLLELHAGPQTVHVWINDGLMAVFFLLVGLELRREMTRGELATPDRLAAPAIAALGGMIVPAIIFSAFNYQDRLAMRGWAVPVATDIAFALAVLSVLGRRVPISLKVFLTALAIIDDLGAIIVIALFYTSALNLLALGGALLVLLALWGLNRAGVRALPPFLLGGVVLWMLLFRSGVHATLSGVALAFVVPMERRAEEDEAPALRLEHALEPWVAYGILPLFGLANAGLSFAALPPGAWFDPVALGAAAGLVVRQADRRVRRRHPRRPRRPCPPARRRDPAAALWRRHPVRHRLHHEPVHRRPRLSRHPARQRDQARRVRRVADLGRARPPRPGLRQPSGSRCGGLKPSRLQGRTARPQRSSA